MNVRELITKLSEFPDDTLVVVNGHEDGVNPVHEVEQVTVALDVYQPDYFGSGAVVRDDPDAEKFPDAEKVPGVWLWGYNDLRERRHAERRRAAGLVGDFDVHH
jgi:hypothetical protein